KHFMKKAVFIFFCVIISINSFSQNWDIDILKQINPRYPTNNTWRTLSSTSEPLSAAVPLGLVAYALITDNHKLEIKSYEIAGSLVVTAAITEGLKIIYNRARPYETYPDIIHPDSYETGHSFPSAHTSLAFSTATSLMLTTKKWYIAVPAYAWATSVAYSRMYLGQHYPSDVIAGAVVGAGSAWLTHWLNKKYFSKRK
ncbi:MAG TPA: phosphatase PAP2 family protein, partial [Chitinophagaceae bacterium]|nr:phosphatase PAP2 family protein [Chitinophagaceae bacterium]